MIAPELFNYFEAGKMIGKKVKIVNEFRGIPPGTMGKVLKTERMFDAYCLAVVWDNVHGYSIKDFVTKNEYNQFFQELS